MGDGGRDGRTLDRGLRGDGRVASLLVGAPPGALDRLYLLAWWLLRSVPVRFAEEKPEALPR